MSKTSREKKEERLRNKREGGKKSGMREGKQANVPGEGREGHEKKPRMMKRTQRGERKEMCPTRGTRRFRSPPNPAGQSQGSARAPWIHLVCLSDPDGVDQKHGCKAIPSSAARRSWHGPSAAALSPCLSGGL